MHTPLHRRPISACWYVTTPGSAVVYHPVDPDPTHQPTPAPSQNFTCRVLNGLYIWEPMTFSTAGQYEFVAMFYNSASTANGTIPFGVFQGECSVLYCSCTHTLCVYSLSSSPGSLIFSTYAQENRAGIGLGMRLLHVCMTSVICDCTSASIAAHLEH